MTAVTDQSSQAASTLAGVSVIDVDTHLTEPADLWTSRAPRAYRDRVPHVEVRSRTSRINGADLGEGSVWVVDDVVLGQAGAGSVVNSSNVKVPGGAFMRWPITEASPAASHVEPRLAIMDELGIWGQIVYPNVVGFGGQRFTEIADVEVRNLCATIWNDAMAEMCEQSGGRLHGMGLVPWWDPRRW